MKIKIALVFMSALTISGVCLAKEKMLKDPLGTKCKASELTEIVSISAPKSKSELPNEYRNSDWVKKIKNM